MRTRSMIDISAPLLGIDAVLPAPDMGPGRELGSAALPAALSNHRSDNDCHELLHQPLHPTLAIASRGPARWSGTHSRPSLDLDSDDSRRSGTLRRVAVIRAGTQLSCCRRDP